MYTTVWCPDCHAAKNFLNKENIEFEEINIENNPEAIKLVQKVNDGKNKVPTFEVDGRYFSLSPFRKDKLIENLKP